MRRRPPRKLRGIISAKRVREKNWLKHHVSEEEVREALAGSALFRFQERGRRRGEDVYAALGPSQGGRRLVVFFIHKLNGEALILSARDMTAAERRYYEARKAHRLQRP